VPSFLKHPFVLILYPLWDTDVNDFPYSAKKTVLKDRYLSPKGCYNTYRGYNKQGESAKENENDEGYQQSERNTKILFDD